MATPLYKQAADALLQLQGAAPYDSLDNEQMGDAQCAKEIAEYFTLRTLVKARAHLDTEQGLAPINIEDPVGCTLDYGKQTKAWLTRQQTTEQAVKHPMVKKAEPEPTDVAASNDLADSIVQFLGKELPDDPNVRLAMWVELSELQKKVKFLEMELRKSLSTHFFPTPKEGANNLPMQAGWKLTNKHTINRKCDEAAFDSVFAELPEGAKDSLIKYKPELNIKPYRSLSADHKRIFDQCLIIKNGSPELKLVEPKEEK